MADQWFVQRDGQRFGPYSAAQLKQMTTTGQLLPVDLVSKGEGSKWVAASQIKGLFAATAPAKQPPPAPVQVAATGPLPPVSASPFDFAGGPPPVPVTAPADAAVEIVDRKVIPTNPVAMALLSGLILIPVGHILMGQVLKAVVVLFAAPWLMVAVGTATGGLGFPVVMLAYAVVMGADAYLLALRRSAGEPVGPWDTPVVSKLLGAKGLLPARIALPILGMLLVVGSGLCLSLFGVKVALIDDSDLRNQLLIAFSLFHCVFAVIAIVLTARLQHAITAPVAAVLTMTVWGWYCFATIPPIASILGLMAGISIGAWALWTFRQPDVKAMFPDAGKPGPLDRLGMPVLAG